MNQKIKSLKSKIALTENSKALAAKPFDVEVEALTQKLNAAYDAVFSKDNELQASILGLEASRNYMVNEYGDLQSWHRISLEAYPEGQVRLQLQRYISENHGLDLNVKEECLINCLGGFLAINDEGDIYLSEAGRNDWIIDHKEYKTEAERNSLIEAYMESTGYYPDVVRLDRYGNVTLVNTLKKTNQA